VNTTVVSLTARVLLGKRRGLFLLILPVILVLLAIPVQMFGNGSDEIATRVLSTFAIGTVVPLLGLIIGTGVIGPEIDDGSIVYLLSKPLPRWKIVVSKLALAAGCVVVFAAVPTLVAGLILANVQVAVGFAVGALLAGVAYCALFLLLAVVTKHAVVIGLFYALIWESLVGNLVPGAQVLSIQRWAQSITNLIADIHPATPGIPAAVGVVLLAVVAVAATWYAGRRLRSLTLSESE
jgi:ABC-2 type transport system permease protein